ncbi:hypothetical protein UFOVP35_40 [uncultured Caudovirales phage]|uniref:Uncharacterized protein n=1 Tax=uncultured Caudovirales phage TaxID=2100421 RepID=A0A6J7WSR1_9CAUD|nr:hypothetical protein UFOVP35_40 [uncultured Caudovirales phage]CAB4124403.1 hypothetical protein UFOVP52_7 [uncultured Caudovirales phage]CAB5219825.1 hypothetical protein UFOVP234_32 [uncultured Caudovirales phage]
MTTEILPKDDIKMIYMACHMKDPNGLYADEVDINEFADKIARVVIIRVAEAERKECIKFVRSLNTEVADALENNRGKL